MLNLSSHRSSPPRINWSSLPSRGIQIYDTRKILFLRRLKILDEQIELLAWLFIASFLAYLFFLLYAL